MSEQQRPYPHIFAQGIRATYRLEKVSSTAPLELVQETRLPLDYEDILSFIAFIGACRKVRGVAASKASGEWAFSRAKVALSPWRVRAPTGLWTHFCHTRKHMKRRWGVMKSPRDERVCLVSGSCQSGSCQMQAKRLGKVRIVSKG